MNKYQEALERLKNTTKTLSLFIFEVVKGLIDTLQELVDIYPEYLELKERATPKKPSIQRAESFASVYEYKLCPLCNASVYERDYDKFCNNCGQAIDWSEE